MSSLWRSIRAYANNSTSTFIGTYTIKKTGYTEEAKNNL
jgi:hypothetical protein